MPKHSKYKKAKRKWYEKPLGSEQKSELQRLFKFALHHDWELRPQFNGVWVIARRRVRLFVAYSEEGNTFSSCIMVMTGKEGGDGFEDEQRRLNRRQMVHVIKKQGRLYYP